MGYNRYHNLKIFCILFMITASLGCVNIQETEPSKDAGTSTTYTEKTTTTAYTEEETTRYVELYIKVIDSRKNTPVVDAVAYIGVDGSSGKCRTNHEGRCVIKKLVEGDYSIGAYKKGYYRNTKPIRLEKGENKAEIVLEQRPEPLKQVTVEGTIIDEVVAEGTRSENHYIKIQTGDGGYYYLFNEIGVNKDFEKYVNKKTTITGYIDKGYIGWQHQEAEGLYVEKIEGVEAEVF